MLLSSDSSKLTQMANRASVIQATINFLWHIKDFRRLLPPTYDVNQVELIGNLKTLPTSFRGGEARWYQTLIYSNFVSSDRSCLSELFILQIATTATLESPLKYLQLCNFQKKRKKWLPKSCYSHPRLCISKIWYTRSPCFSPKMLQRVRLQKLRLMSMSIKQKSLEESQMKNLKSKDLVHFTTGQGSHNGYIIDELMGKVTATKKTVSLKDYIDFFSSRPFL